MFFAVIVGFQSILLFFVGFCFSGSVDYQHTNIEIMIDGSGNATVRGDLSFRFHMFFQRHSNNLGFDRQWRHH